MKPLKTIYRILLAIGLCLMLLGFMLSSPKLLGVGAMVNAITFFALLVAVLRGHQIHNAVNPRH